MGGALEGIRVIDWSWWHQGPAVGYILGDMGADVIKIEDTVHGDPFRGLTRFMGVDVRLPDDHVPHFELANRNKRGITLDLTKEAGRQILYRLVTKSDVFINNFRLTVRRRLGVDYPSLARHNPRLIYATASGFGTEGPDAELRAFDTIGYARSGLMFNIGEPDMPPQQMIFGVGDQIGATVLALGITAALVARQRTGRGQEVEASLYGSLIHAQAMAQVTYLMTGQEPPRPARSRQFNPLIGWYQCKDGEWIIFAHNQPQEVWRRFCKALGVEELVDDPRFATTKARGEHHRELIAIIDQVMGLKTRDQWMAVFRQHDLVFGPVVRLSDVAKDAQALANRYIVDYQHPSLPLQKTVGFPIAFSETPSEIRRPAPEFGQHTEEVLMEVCGYSWDEISRFREEEVI